jgi:ATP-binding protein involved in chromosome partitioning
MNMAKKMEIKRIGIVENMSGLICPHCGNRIDLFGTGGGKRDAALFGASFLGEVPIDPQVRKGADIGQPIVLVDPNAEVSQAFLTIATRIEEALVEETSGARR